MVCFKNKNQFGQSERVVSEYILTAGQFYCWRKDTTKRSMKGNLGKIDTGVRI